MKKLIPFSVLPMLAFAQEATPNASGGMTQMILMIGLALVFFYLILWRPEQKRRKAGEAMRASMKKGDRVTAMAIVGTIDRINDQTIVLKTVDSKIEILKAAITDVQSASSESSEA